MTAAAATTPQRVAGAICDALADPDVVLVRVWVLETVSMLRLLASAGHPSGGGSYHRIDGGFSRIANGVGKIGRVAGSGAPLLVKDLRGDEDWLSNPGWIARQGVRGFAAFPLSGSQHPMGVLAIFTRTPLTDVAVADLQFVADFIAARLNALTQSTPSILTRTDLRQLEKRSIEIALAHANGKVFGTDGAAALLQIKPTTLASRIKTLGVSTSSKRRQDP